MTTTTLTRPLTGGLALEGCRTEPLGSYLRGLGVFRLVAEQLDPTVTGCWEGDRLVLAFAAPRSLDDVVAFLVDRYRPTPVVSPWNGGSGFHPKDNTEGIDAVSGSTGDRLAAFRDSIARARALVGRPDWEELSKADRVQWCRNELPDEAVPWLDAAVVLSEDGLVFPPLLGTGGNVGRLDFSNNLMQRLADVLCLRTGRRAPGRGDSVAWARAALAGTSATGLVGKAIGQFDPGAAGGTNAPTGGPEESLVNPWSFVLTFEGALLFASGAARRLTVGARGKAAMPFTFDVTPAGYPSAVDGESARGEFWAPVWSRPVTLPEVARLLGEGRAQWNGAQARRGVDVARAAVNLGVDRGIDEFVRHAFVERMGQSMLAVPVGRVRTDVNPLVPVLADLDRWVERVRRVKNLPAAPAAALRRLDAAMLALANEAEGERRFLQEVLATAAELDGAVARSRQLRGEVPEPLGNPTRRTGEGSPVPLDARRWVPLIDDQSTELRLALALASGRDPLPRGSRRADDRGGDDGAGGDESAVAATATGGADDETEDEAGATPGNGGGDFGTDHRHTAATLLRGVRPVGRRQLAWRPDGRPVVGGLGHGSLVAVLGELVQRRTIEASARRDLWDVTAGRARPEAGQVGVDPGFARADCAASWEQVGAFLGGELDEARLDRLLSALLLLRFEGGRVHVPRVAPGRVPGIPTAAALVLPFFHGRPIPVSGMPDGIRLRAARRWPHLLAADRVAEVVTDACHRLRVARLTPRVGAAEAIARGVDGPRLLASAAFPLTTGAAAHLLRTVATTRDQIDSLHPGG